MAELWISQPELEELIGRDAADRLCRVRGGSPMYIPASAAPGHALEQIVGPRAMQALCAEYGGMDVTVPNGRKAEPRKGDILDLLDQGRSHSAVATALGVTERYVRMVASSRPRHAQLTLPGFER